MNTPYKRAHFHAAAQPATPLHDRQEHYDQRQQQQQRAYSANEEAKRRQQMEQQPQL